METINTIELIDPDVFPDADILREVLQGSYGAYTELLDLFNKHGLTTEWRYYNDGKAWLCKVQKKKKTVIWMSAWKGYMQVAVYVPLRLLDDVLATSISALCRNKIIETKNVGRSKPCIVEVRKSENLQDVEQLILFKLTAK